MELFTMVLFTASIGFVFLYSLIQLNLLVHYFRARSRPTVPIQAEALTEYPFVTIQLPVYNEFYVAARLIDNICLLEYPKDRFEVQILDDSDDETSQIIAKKVQEYNALGFDIRQIQRSSRTGFKAGALAHGFESARGEFIAIFDADFLPLPGFLKEVIPYFGKPKIGVVQTRWSYTNGGYSLLTAAQEFGLNGHFTVEQTGRNEGRHFINFNGTAGVWRRSVILDSGGWNSDTLTEDLDLSYRAQLRGWKFKFVQNIPSPSELPVEMNALRAQQFRWTKGAAQCVRKNLIAVIRSKSLPLSTKIHAFFHLTNSTIFVFVFLLSLLILPVTIIKSTTDNFVWLTRLSSVFMASWFILGLFYWTANRNAGESWKKYLLSFTWKFPLFLAISMGLSLHNAIAVVEGYIGRKSPFLRTPKFNVHDAEDRWETNRYVTRKISPYTWLEGAMLVYSIISLEVSIYYFSPGLLPMNILLVGGYGIVFFGSILHSRRSVRQLRVREAY